MIKFSSKQVTKLEATHMIIGSATLNSTPSRALDLLIASNNFERIGFLDSPHIEPAVGYLNSKVHPDIGLPAQIYKKDDVIIVQIRSCIRMGRKKQFIEDLSKIFNSSIKAENIIVVGSLAFSARPDLQIQSVGKNVYYYSKVAQEGLKKAEETGIIQPLKLLVETDDEETQIIGEAGFVKTAVKSKEFPNFGFICVFSQDGIDHEAAAKLAKAVSVVCNKKQLGVVDQTILNE